MDVTICIGTFGHQRWINLAHERAIPSGEAQGVEVIHRHGTDLAHARNEALGLVRTDFVVFLDADDELEPGYLEAMARGSADVRGPLVRFMVDGRERNLWQPRVWSHRHDCTAECLEDGNWLVIGSMARAELVRSVGGFRDFQWSEDWDVWLRCKRAGATFELIRDAIYRAHVRPDSRNRAPDQAAKLAAHEAIVEANRQPLFASCGCMIPHGFRPAEHSRDCPHRVAA